MVTPEGRSSGSQTDRGSLLFPLLPESQMPRAMPLGLLEGDDCLQNPVCSESMIPGKGTSCEHGTVTFHVWGVEG